MDSTHGMDIRGNNCNGCPFKKGIQLAYLESGDRPQPPMLCHESECLGGTVDHDIVCAGWDKYCYDSDGMIV